MQLSLLTNPLYFSTIDNMTLIFAHRLLNISEPGTQKIFFQNTQLYIGKWQAMQDNILFGAN